LQFIKIGEHFRLIRRKIRMDPDMFQPTFFLQVWQENGEYIGNSAVESFQVFAYPNGLGAFV
jgi:hypothetical protein